jgi:hypothetical protein
MQSISVGPDGTTLHPTFQFHYAETGRAIDCKGYAAVYLRSDDGGDTWFNEGTRLGSLPLTVETMNPICRHPEGEVRIGNHVVDEQDRPWLYSALPGSAGGVLWHRADDGWVQQDTASTFQPLNMLGPRSTALSRATNSQLHLLFATDPGHQETAWFDPRHELFHLAWINMARRWRWSS